MKISKVKLYENYNLLRITFQDEKLCELWLISFHIVFLILVFGHYNPYL